MRKYIVAAVSALVGGGLVWAGIWIDSAISKLDVALGNFNSGSRAAGALSTFGLIVDFSQ